MAKKCVAVVFGGRSAEHDVSVLTGLQAIEAVDQARFDTLPVYVDPQGRWWTGDALLSRKNYPLTDQLRKGLTPLLLDLAAGTAGQAQFITLKSGMMGQKATPLPFDLIVPAIHGSNGEDGTLQGLLEFGDIPYSGSTTLGAAIAMDKLAAKRLARDRDIPVLPEVAIARPSDGQFLDQGELEKSLIAEFGHIEFPLIAKPVSLGSSIGVQRVEDIDGLMAALISIFKLDHRAMVEPCVTPLKEYNVAVRRKADGSLVSSAIERPKTPGEVLDFQGKYLAGNKAGAPKLDGPPSEGMVSLSREINPGCILPEVEQTIRNHAVALFDALDLGGSVRFDFLANADTQEIWFNEANTIPGSFAYFLWEAAEERISFRELMTGMIEEGFSRQRTSLRITDVAAAGAQIFKGA